MARECLKNCTDGGVLQNTASVTNQQVSFSQIPMSGIETPCVIKYVRAAFVFSTRAS